MDITTGAVWAVILARRGSRSIPLKNLEEVGGRPLVLIAVEQAIRCAVIDRVVLSTDDSAIAEVVEGLDVDVVMRPAHLATDDARSAPAAIHALESLRASRLDTAVLLQPTSPLRNDRDVRETLAALPGFGSSLTVRELSSHPLKALIESPSGYVPTRRLEDLEAPRQALPRAVAPNGAVYAVGVGDLMMNESFLIEPINAVLMPEARSIDIDGPGDLALVRDLLAQRPGALSGTAAD